MSSRDFHTHFPGSGVGKQHPYLLRLYRPHKTLDYGCGKGGTVDWLNAQGYNVTGYDTSAPGFTNVETLKQHYDAIYTQDVLEHIALDEIPWALFNTAGENIHIVDLTPAKKRLPDGRNAHITLLSAEQWLELFDKHLKFKTLHWELDHQPDPNFGTRRRLCAHLQ